MRPLTLKNTLWVATALLVLATGVLISLLAAERYSASLREAAKAQAEQVAHKLSLDAAERILIHDLAGLQRLLEAQIASHPAVSYIFILHEGEILSHTFEAGVPAELMAAKAMLYRAAWQAARGGASRKEVHAMAAAVKLVCSETAGRVVDRAVQVHGGRGYMREQPVERLYREVRVDRIWEGTSEIQRAIVGNELRKRGHGIYTGWPS